MDKKEKRIRISVALILLALLVVVISIWGLTEFQRHQKYQSWSAEYIDSFLGSSVPGFHDDVEKLFYVHDLEEGDGVIALCSGKPANESKDALYFVYMEGDFPDHDSKGLEIRTLENLYDHDEKTVFKSDWIITSSYKDQDIYYNLYLNPTTDTLKVNGEEVQVEKIPIELEGKSYTLGFWYKLLPKDTVVTVE